MTKQKAVDYCEKQSFKVVKYTQGYSFNVIEYDKVKHA